MRSVIINYCFHKTHIKVKWMETYYLCDTLKDLYYKQQYGKYLY